MNTEGDVDKLIVLLRLVAQRRKMEGLRNCKDVDVLRDLADGLGVAIATSPKTEV